MLTTFQLSLRQREGCHQLRGRDRDLLTLQRRVHQGRRLLGQGALRLEVDALVWPLLVPTTLPSWHMGCSDYLNPAGTRDLLSDHVLEAWLGPIHADDAAMEACAGGAGMRFLPLLQSVNPSIWLPSPADERPAGTELLTIALMVAESHADHAGVTALCQSVRQQHHRLTARHPGLKLPVAATGASEAAVNQGMATTLATTID